jgi:hypothetical protein
MKKEGLACLGLIVIFTVLYYYDKHVTVFKTLGIILFTSYYCAIETLLHVIEYLIWWPPGNQQGLAFSGFCTDAYTVWIQLLWEWRFDFINNI